MFIVLDTWDSSVNKVLVLIKLTFQREAKNDLKRYILKNKTKHEKEKSQKFFIQWCAWKCLIGSGKIKEI